MAELKDIPASMRRDGQRRGHDNKSARDSTDVYTFFVMICIDFFMFDDAENRAAKAKTLIEFLNPNSSDKYTKAACAAFTIAAFSGAKRKLCEGAGALFTALVAGEGLSHDFSRDPEFRNKVRQHMEWVTRKTAGTGVTLPEIVRNIMTGTGGRDGTVSKSTCAAPSVPSAWRKAPFSQFGEGRP